MSKVDLYLLKEDIDHLIRRYNIMATELNEDTIALSETASDKETSNYEIFETRTFTDKGILSKTLTTLGFRHDGREIFSVNIKDGATFVNSKNEFALITSHNYGEYSVSFSK